RDLIVKKIEEAVIDKTRGTVLNLVPERTSEDDYLEGLAVIDMEFEGEQPPEEWSLIHAITGLLALLLGERAAGWVAFLRDRRRTDRNSPDLDPDVEVPT
ncbi:MAG: hypothetical protein HUJ26_00080, partial [Planctomycetaceae bacterium]|nr:hypothetical protein [Planctomycetaceae bacterium]